MPRILFEGYYCKGKEKEGQEGNKINCMLS